MSKQTDLLRAERDLALRFCAAEDARSAIKAGISAFESSFPTCGICIFARLGDSSLEEHGGNLAEEALELALGQVVPDEGGRFRRFVRDVGQDGLKLRLAAIVRDGKRPGALAANYLERLGSALESTLARMEKTRLLAEALRDCELLGRESRHRLRNSLQYYLSTLSLFMPRGNVLSPPDLDRLERRIAAFIAIHDMLESTGKVGLVPAADYFFALGETLRKIIFDASGSFVARYETEESPLLAPDRATTIGLIVHELVMNSTKHARGRQIRMVLAVGFRENELELRYFDEAEAADGDGEEVAELSSDYGEQAGSGLLIVTDLLARAEARRTDDGSSPHVFAACFPVGARI